MTRAVDGTVGDVDPSGTDPQNTPSQILVIERSVSTLPARATTTIGVAISAMPASMRASLATNPENGGSPARLNAGSANSNATTDVVRPSRHPVERRRSLIFLDQATDEEQDRLDRDLVNEEQHGAGDTGNGEQPETHQHVADLADDVERQNALHVVLGEGSGDADQHRDPGDDQDHRARGRPSR